MDSVITILPQIFFLPSSAFYNLIFKKSYYEEALARDLHVKDNKELKFSLGRCSFGRHLVKSSAGNSIDTEKEFMKINTLRYFDSAHGRHYSPFAAVGIIFFCKKIPKLFPKSWRFYLLGNAANFLSLTTLSSSKYNLDDQNSTG